MPHSIKQQRISSKLIVYIILFSSMITGILTVIQLYYEYIDDKVALDRNIENVNAGYRKSITNAVWLDDKEQLIAILDGVVALPDIEFIEVRVNDEHYAGRGEKVLSNSMGISFDLSYEHDNRMLSIGETRVEADLSAIYQRLLNHAWSILGFNAIKTFIVAMFMFYLFRRLVVGRLTDLAAEVRLYDKHNVDGPVKPEPLTGKDNPDEIDDIASAINTMQCHLSDSVREMLGLKRTLDLSLDGVFMFYPDTCRFFYVNTGAVNLLGYTAEELSEMTPVDISDDLSETQFSDLIKETLKAENHAVNIETLFRSKKGKSIPVTLLLQYLQPRDEAPRYIFMARDISEHISAEHEVRASLADAKAANIELESFSYSISHDLRTPLRSIDGFSHLLLEDCGNILNEKAKGYIHRVRKNAQRMGVLIDAMLSLSNVSRGEIHRERHNLSEMAEKAVKKLQDFETQRGVTIKIMPGMYGWVDKSLFDNLLDNLLGNAWKYTGKVSNPEIEFGCKAQDKETVYYIRDNGAGFDMRYKEKLFNAFQRLHKDEEFDGTGIGLATVSRILRKHGGRIWAMAEIDSGATFYFTLEKENRQIIDSDTHNLQSRPEL